MIATILISIVLIVAVGFVLYRQFTGKDKHCEDCATNCPVKHAQETTQSK